MRKHQAPPTAVMRDSAFATLLCATLALLLLTTSAFRQGGGSPAQIAGVFISASLVVLMFRRVLSYWSPAPAPRAPTTGKLPAWKRGMGAAGAYCLAAGLAYAISGTILDGWFSPFVITALIVIYLPWGKILPHRLYCIACWAAALAGSGLAVILSTARTSSILFLMATWLLLAMSTASWLRLVEHTRKWRRLSGLDT